MTISTKYHSTIAHLNAGIKARHGSSLKPHTNHLMAEAARLEKAVKALGDVYARKSPLDTDAAHFKKVAHHARRLEKETADASNRIKNLQIASITRVQDSITERLNLNETPYAGELRQTLRGMDNKDRHSAIKQLMQQGDSASMAAILKAPAMLSGITEELQNRYIVSYEEAQAPDLVLERADLVETVADLHAMVNASGKAAESFLDPARIRDIEEGERLAGEAESSFTQAFNSGEV